MLHYKNLHNYQLVTIEHMIDNTHAAAFLEMGCGKTVSTLTALKLLMGTMEVFKTLVIAPKRVAESVWTDEIKKWSHLKNMRTVRVIGTAAQRAAALREDADIYLLGRDNVPWMVAHFGGSYMPFDTLVIDESSSFKNAKSKRFKALKMIQPLFDRVILLTGTPAPSGVESLWSQVYLLDRGARLGKNISRFRKEFMTAGASKGHIVYKYNPQADAEARIFDKIGDLCISMKADDVLDSMPEKFVNYIDVKFDKKTQKQYNDFKLESVLEIMEENNYTDVSEITAATGAILSNKLLQFSAGAIYDEKRNVHQIHDLKLDALDEIVESMGGKPLLIAYSYRHDIARIQERFKKLRPVLMKGEDDIKAWNRGEIPLMLISPQGAGHGLNLQDGGDTLVWFNLPWSLELFQQTGARLHRQGQKSKRTTQHVIMTSDTIEKKVVAALTKKGATQDGLMDAVRAEIIDLDINYLINRKK